MAHDATQLPDAAPDIEVVDARTALEWVRYQLTALCEATEDSPVLAECVTGAHGLHAQGFARGRKDEAKGIRRAMFEVITCKMRELPDAV